MFTVGKTKNFKSTILSLTKPTLALQYSRHIPVVPDVILGLGKGHVGILVEKLGASGRYRQMDVLVRRFRHKYGKDQLKGDYAFLGSWGLLF